MNEMSRLSIRVTMQAHWLQGEPVLLSSDPHGLGWSLGPGHSRAVCDQLVIDSMRTWKEATRRVFRAAPLLTLQPGKGKASLRMGEQRS